MYCGACCGSQKACRLRRPHQGRDVGWHLMKHLFPMLTFLSGIRSLVRLPDQASFFLQSRFCFCKNNYKASSSSSGPSTGEEGGGVRSWPGTARTILLFHIISVRPSNSLVWYVPSVNSQHSASQDTLRDCTKCRGILACARFKALSRTESDEASSRSCCAQLTI